MEGYGEFIAVEFTFVAWICEGPIRVRRVGGCWVPYAFHVGSWETTLTENFDCRVSSNSTLSKTIPSLENPIINTKLASSIVEYTSSRLL
jgi:hypothetical protein